MEIKEVKIMKYIFLISGKMRVGKNQLADYMKQYVNWKYPDKFTEIDSFASTLKKWCSQDFKELTNYLNDFTDKLKATIFNNLTLDSRSSLTNQISNVIDQIKTKDSNWFDDKNDITRILLQLTGTSIFRNRINENFWANITRDNVQKSISDFIWIADCRFPVECETLMQLNSDNCKVVSIRVERNTNNNIGSQHESEIALDNWKDWNYVIDNSGLLETLKESAKTIIDDVLSEEEK
jgi:hypothetical protein